MPAFSSCIISSNIKQHANEESRTTITATPQNVIQQAPAVSSYISHHHQQQQQQQ